MRYNDLIFDNNSKAYLRTTENINGYYNKLNFRDKKVLTVIGSGDHIFEAILRGAKEVEGFDISENAILLYYLKEAAIKTMDFEEYMNFFYVQNKCFTKEGYNILRTRLNEITLPYWDKVFASSTKEPLDYIKEMLVSKPAFYMVPSVASLKLSALSSYLEEENYYELQSKIDNAKVSIHLRDVKDVDKVEGPFDYIILSNIFEYQDTEEFKKLIDKYKEHLNEDGLIIAGYAYHDMDLSYYSEYDSFEIPSRYTLNGMYGAPSDRVMTTGKRNKK